MSALARLSSRSATFTSARPERSLVTAHGNCEFAVVAVAGEVVAAARRIRRDSPPLPSLSSYTPSHLCHSDPHHTYTPFVTVIPVFLLSVSPLLTTTALSHSLSLLIKISPGTWLDQGWVRRPKRQRRGEGGLHKLLFHRDGQR